MLSLLIVFCSLFSAPALAEDCNIDCLNNRIQEYETKLKDLSGQKKTLASTVAYLNAQINLTQSTIAKTEQELVVLAKEIETLSGHVNQLNVSLDNLSSVLRGRIRKTYKQYSIDPVYLLFSARGFGDFFNEYKYLNTIQEHDREVLMSMERTRFNYDYQKTQKEEAQQKAEALHEKLKKQKASLAAQQQDKKNLLDQTQNDEKRYQTMLDSARAELAAIQNIIAGKGEETKAGDVGEGNRIASIITGSSACSTGTHLHFEVAKNGANQDPANYLNNKSVTWDNSPDGPFSFTGGWPWPMNDPVRITQGYGNTSYSSRYANHSHTGIDMVSTNTEVKSVKSGTLYRGAISCGGGTLRYVKVEQGDNLVTYYLHVNY